jgi:hypothetical protein
LQARGGVVELTAERVALLAQFLNRGDRFFHAVVEASEDFFFLGAGKGELVVFAGLLHVGFLSQSNFTGSMAARRVASW